MLHICFVNHYIHRLVLSLRKTLLSAADISATIADISFPTSSLWVMALTIMKLIVIWSMSALSMIMALSILRIMTTKVELTKLFVHYENSVVRKYD